MKWTLEDHLNRQEQLRDVLDKLQQSMSQVQIAYHGVITMNTPTATGGRQRRNITGYIHATNMQYCIVRLSVEPRGEDDVYELVHLRDIETVTFIAQLTDTN